MKKKIMALMLVAACMLSTLCGSLAAQAEVIHETTLEDYIMQEMSSANILGMGISIVSAEKELYCAAYGAAGKTSADYVLGNVSKSFTAAGIMRLAEDGDLALTDTVSKYLPQYTGVADVTIQELLNHTGGITTEQTMSDLSVTGKKGEFQYANANYNLLGEVIEEVSGMSYEEYISDNILDPLGMESTYSMRTGSDLSEELLTGYQSYFGFPYSVKHKYDAEDDWMQVPSAYMISDIKDMGKYLQMYLQDGGDVLSKESVEAMLYNGVDTSTDKKAASDMFGGNAKYGMGWMEKEVNGKKLLYHSGKVENFATMMVLLPEQDLGIMMMFNSMDYLVGQKLIETVEEGIVSIEMGETPAKTDGKTYLLKHGLYDILMILAVIAAWMPIFLMGVWSRKRRNQLLYIPGLVVDIVVQLVLPSVILLVWTKALPVYMIKRFIPDLYYVVWAVILSLYMGGIVKLITGLVLMVLGSKEEPLKEQETEKEEKAEKLEQVTEEEEKPEEPKQTTGGEEKPKEPEQATEDEEKAEKPEQATEEEEKPKANKAEPEEAEQGKPDMKRSEIEKPEEISKDKEEPQKSDKTRHEQTEESKAKKVRKNQSRKRTGKKK